MNPYRENPVPVFLIRRIFKALLASTLRPSYHLSVEALYSSYAPGGGLYGFEVEHNTF